MANTKIPSVLWNVDQTEVLSSDNKTQARTNIDAASTGAVETVQTNLNNHKHKVQFNSESAIELTCNNGTATSLNHSHGNITTDGKVTANAAAIGNKDTLLIVDYDDNNIVKKTTIEFDGNTTTKALTKAGTWESFTNYTHPDGSAASKTGVPTGDVTLTFGGSFKVNQISTDSTSHVSAVTERTITMPSLGTTSTTAAAGDHGHGAITKDGKIGTAADKLVVTGTGGALTTGGTASDLVHDSNYVHTDNNFTNTLKTRLDSIESGAEVNVQSNWNETNSSSDAFILNKPVVIEGQIQLLVGGTKQFKKLTIDNSGFAGTPAAVSVTSTEDTTYTPGYLVTPADSANKYLRSGTGGVPEWDDLDMGTYEEYEDEQTSYAVDLTKIYVEKLYNGNERIKFNTESSYKYLVPPPSPNRQLVTNSGGVMQWDTINANISVREIAYRESNGTQADSTIYNDVSDDVESGKTPMLLSAGEYGRQYYYIFKRRVGGYSGQPITYVFEGNDTYQNRIIRKLITNGTITTEVVPLQGRLTAGSGISIDSNTNEIMCTGTGQVVDGIFKQVDSAGTRYTIQFGIGNQNNQYLDLVKTDISTTPNSTLSATHINEESVQSHFINVKAKGSNYIGKFWASQSDTIPGQATPNASSSIRQLSTALHSVYDGTLSGTPGSQEVPIDRVTLYGNTNYSYDDNNLGNLTVGTLAMRIINASSTNPSHQLLASCVKGEIDLIYVNKAEELYTLTSDSASSYIGVATNDCMLMVTTNPRKCTDAVARTKQAGDSDLGSIVMFPSKAYIDGQLENLNDIYLKQSFVSTAHVRLKTDTTFSNGNTSIMSTTLTVAGNGTGTYDLQPIARKADRNGLISITITSLSPGKKCIMSVIGHASGESVFNTLLRFGGESDTALALYSYSATIPVIYAWSTYGGSFNISINNTESSSVKYLIQVTAISGPCDYYP